MFKLGKHFKSMMMWFSILTFLLIGYAAAESLHEAAKKANLNE